MPSFSIDALNAQPFSPIIDTIISKIDKIQITFDTEFDTFIDKINQIGCIYLNFRLYHLSFSKHHIYTYAKDLKNPLFLISLKERILLTLKKVRHEALNNLNTIIGINISYFYHQLNDTEYSTKSYDMSCYSYTIQ